MKIHGSERGFVHVERLIHGRRHRDELRVRLAHVIDLDGDAPVDQQAVPQRARVSRKARRRLSPPVALDPHVAAGHRLPVTGHPHVARMRGRGPEPWRPHIGRAGPRVYPPIDLEGHRVLGNVFGYDRNLQAMVVMGGHFTGPAFLDPTQQTVNPTVSWLYRFGN